jgi:cytochrome c
MLSRKQLIAALVLTIFASAVDMQAQGTKDEAVTNVKKAIAFYKANGVEKTFAEINNKSGQFTKDDIYITVYDMSGKCLAHGFNSKMIGKNLIDLKDPDGTYFIRDRIELAKKKGSGWQDYKFANPTTLKTENKTMYIEKIDNYIFACGVYK